MKTIFQTSILLAGVLVAFCSHAGDITGAVTLKGTPPKERTIDLDEHPALAAKHPMGLTTRHYQVGNDNGLQNVLVYVKADFAGRRFEPPRAPVVLDHVDGLFQPYVAGIQVGQPLQLRCTDGTICGFHATTRKNREFVISPLKSTVSRAFSASEVPVRFKCDLHPWNYAYVGVFAHPFFAVTDKHGRFTIPGVPAGHYTLEIFHPTAGRSSKDVEVSNGKTVADFTVAAK